LPSTIHQKSGARLRLLKSVHGAPSAFLTDALHLTRAPMSFFSSSSPTASVVRPAAPAGTALPAAAAAPVAGTTLLVVDDSAMIRKAVTQTLLDRGYLIVQAENGRIALETWEREPDRFTLVLSDVFMPEMDGLTLGRELRRRSRTLPIILMSSKLDEDSRWIAEEAGFRLMPKPFKDSYLLELVARMIQMRPAR
jgi:CheY-like chemotaxis protein